MFDSQKYLSYLSFSPLLSTACLESFCPRPTLPFFHFSLPFSHFSPFTLILQSFLVSLSLLFLLFNPSLYLPSLFLSLFLLLYYSFIYSFSSCIHSFSSLTYLFLFIIYSLSSFHCQQRGKKKEIREVSYSYFCSLQTR